MHASLQSFAVKRGVWRLRRNIVPPNSSNKCVVDRLELKTLCRFLHVLKEFTLPNRYDILHHPGQHERLRAVCAEAHAIELYNHLLRYMPRTDDESL
jgi:hypothetical protein